MMSPDERLCAAQPGASAVGEMCYNEPQDSNNGADDMALFNQLLEMPELWEMLPDPSLATSMLAGFEQAPNANSAFASVDMNFNQNFGSCPQDFSRYSDFQFNMLVNENQTPQSEAQDSPSNMLHVKKEEDL